VLWIAEGTAGNARFNQTGTTYLSEKRARLSTDKLTYLYTDVTCTHLCRIKIEIRVLFLGTFIGGYQLFGRICCSHLQDADMSDHFVGLLHSNSEY